MYTHLLNKGFDLLLNNSTVTLQDVVKACDTYQSAYEFMTYFSSRQLIVEGESGIYAVTDDKVSLIHAMLDALARQPKSRHLSLIHKASELGLEKMTIIKRINEQKLATIDLLMEEFGDKYSREYFIGLTDSGLVKLCGEYVFIAVNPQDIDALYTIAKQKETLTASTKPTT